MAIYGFIFGVLKFMIIHHIGAILVILGISFTFEPHPDEVELNDSIDREREPLIKKKDKLRNAQKEIDDFNNMVREVEEEERDS